VVLYSTTALAMLNYNYKLLQNVARIQGRES